MKNVKRVIKKIPKKIIAIVMLIAMIYSYVMPLTSVAATEYGNTEDNFIKADVVNNTDFTFSMTINSEDWENANDVFHGANDGYHIVINVSGNDATGDTLPEIMYGGPWNNYIQKGFFRNDDDPNDKNYQFILDIDLKDVSDEKRDEYKFLGLTLVEREEEQQPQPGEGGQNPNPGPVPGEVEAGPEPGESYFDGRAYVVWSCGSGICYHYFDNIPNFDDGNSTFYKDTEVTADNKNGVIFDVKAKYKGWYLADEFDEWKDLYTVATGKALNWDTMDPELILGEPNQHIKELEEAAIKAKVCTELAKDAGRKERKESEKCINRYAAEYEHKIWTHQLQPVGEPNYNNDFVSYGDRNFKVAIYSSEFKGVAMGDLSELSYYPAEWTNPFIKRDHFDLSESTKDKPAVLNSILLESTVMIKTLDYNSFEIASIEALDVPEDAVEITKVNGEFKLVYSSNFYDNVVFKVTDTKGGIYYMQVNRYTLDGWIGTHENHPILIADFYFDKEKKYSDFNITAKIVYKDGSTKNVSLEARNGIDDGLGNITEGYEIDESNPEFGEGGKGLKRSTFVYDLKNGEDRTIQDVYFNVEYKGSTETNYAGAYVGSGQGVRANIYHGEDE